MSGHTVCAPLIPAKTRHLFGGNRQCGRIAGRWKKRQEDGSGGPKVRARPAAADSVFCPKELTDWRFPAYKLLKFTYSYDFQGARVGANLLKINANYHRKLW